MEQSFFFQDNRNVMRMTYIQADATIYVRWLGFVVLRDRTAAFGGTHRYAALLKSAGGELIVGWMSDIGVIGGGGGLYFFFERICSFQGGIEFGGACLKQMCLWEGGCVSVENRRSRLLGFWNWKSASRSRTSLNAVREAHVKGWRLWRPDVVDFLNRNVVHTYMYS